MLPFSSSPLVSCVLRPRRVLSFLFLEYAIATEWVESFPFGPLLVSSLFQRIDLVDECQKRIWFAHFLEIRLTPLGRIVHVFCDVVGLRKPQNVYVADINAFSVARTNVRVVYTSLCLE